MPGKAKPRKSTKSKPSKPVLLKLVTTEKEEDEAKGEATETGGASGQLGGSELSDEEPEECIEDPTGGAQKGPTDDTEGGSQNQRERQRQLHVNSAFASLRSVVPSHPLDKKMSKHEILRAAIRYIRVLETQLRAMDEQEGQE